MNHLVLVDTHAGELEKILSGVKKMVLKEFDPAQSTAHPVSPGDYLYFLRDKGDLSLRVKATVVRVLLAELKSDEDLSPILKEMQPKLQLTEAQFVSWSAKRRVLMVDFTDAQKIPLIQVAPNKITDRLNWLTFETFNFIMK